MVISCGQNPLLISPATFVFLYSPPIPSAVMARLSALLVLLFSAFPPTAFRLFATAAQQTPEANDGGYIGYSLKRDGDQGSAVYETADTPSNASAATLPPDVYLNASIHVGEIDITVKNLTAQINIAAQVLSLLDFNAGVDVSIDRVSLTIQNVTAEVLLEARLENLVRMIDNVLDSLDLNPTLATLGQDVGEIANTTASAVSKAGSGTSASPLAERGLEWEFDQGILYSINDYSGNTHTNRILEQNGDIVEQRLHNDGTIYHRSVVGNYLTDMHSTGYDASVVVEGKEERESEYVYAPVPGISAICAIFTNTNDQAHVLRTQVLSEQRAGGGSTISGQLKG